MDPRRVREQFILKGTTVILEKQANKRKRQVDQKVSPLSDIKECKCHYTCFYLKSQN